MLRPCAAVKRQGTTCVPRERSSGPHARAARARARALGRSPLAPPLFFQRSPCARALLYRRAMLGTDTQPDAAAGRQALHHLDVRVRDGVSVSALFFDARGLVRCVSHATPLGLVRHFHWSPGSESRHASGSVDIDTGLERARFDLGAGALGRLTLALPGGARVRASLRGRGAIPAPAIDAEIVVPPMITLLASPARGEHIDRRRDLRVAWSRELSVPEATLEIVIERPFGPGAPVGTAVSCAFPAHAGEGVVSGALLAQLGDGRGRVFMRSSTSASARVGGFDVTVAAHSAAFSDQAAPHTAIPVIIE